MVARLLSAGEHPAPAPDPAVAAKLVEPLSSGGDGAACGARAARRAFAARRQALPQRLSPRALFKIAAPGHGAYAGGGLRGR